MKNRFLPLDGRNYCDNLPTFHDVTPRLPADCRGERDLYNTVVTTLPKKAD